MRKKVFVSGCFDMLHSGHIAFLQQAHQLGDVYVGIGSDKNIQLLKNRTPVNSEEDRLYNLEALKYVKKVFINSGTGIIDFEQELFDRNFDIFFVNEDGHTIEKQDLCKRLGIEYIVSKRLPYQQLEVRSTTDRISSSTFPYRIDLAGGWLDQPFVSQYYPGCVIVIGIEPNATFNERSGMATSTRNRAIELWNNSVPLPSEKNARILFAYENPPGKKEISGSQDALGILLPGVNILHYDNNYWPHKIESIQSEEIFNWLEQHLFLIELSPRYQGFAVLSNTDITFEKVKDLSQASEKCASAIETMDLNLLAKYATASFKAQVEMFPNMVNSDIIETILGIVDKVLGYKISGAGGGGYIICVAEKSPAEDALRIKIRRK